MTPERWQQVKQLAGEALDLGPGERVAFLAKACATDPELHAEVASLLAADDPSGKFLEPDRPPDRIGVYRIVREIGRGGMGAVYLADRWDEQFEQRVAIKILKRGMDSQAVVRRFLAERQILARLQHPNIARLLDGGMTSDGRPYFVMEYLDAEPIGQYCRNRALSIAQRLELFTPVCDAVEHAHSHLVLHRDIKPENILVDQRGTPKLLDFGIAKLLETNGDAGALQTEVGQRAMTPQFGSPEQMRGEPLTTASDIYAMGLLLYELVADRPPYEVKGVPFAEQMRVVCESKPTRPSEVAPAAVARGIRGDLDNVVLKALDKDPARRYSRAADLAEDLRRFRGNRPVTARPDSLAYRARKYASRHRRGLAVAGLLTAIVTAAVGNALVQGRRAERHFQEVRQLANSFLFEFHDAIAGLPGATPARELVVKRALQYLDVLSREAAADADLKRELAESYLRVGEAQGLYFESNLGKAADARASFEKAVALFSDVARVRPSDARARTDLANAMLRLSSALDKNESARALSLTGDTIDLLAGAAAQGPLEPRAQLVLGQAYFGMAENHLRNDRVAESLEARNRSIAVLEESAGRQPRSEDAERWLSQSLKRRAALYIGHMNDPVRARADLSRATQIDEQRAARDPASAVARLDLALGQGYLSAVLRRTGDLAAAEATLRRAMALRQQILGADPQNFRVRILLLGDYAKLAAILRERHEPAASRGAVQQALSLASAVTGAAAGNAELLQALDVIRREAALNGQ